ncbi:MAG: caspase family protein [Salinivirgaceae bacterium]
MQKKYLLLLNLVLFIFLVYDTPVYAQYNSIALLNEYESFVLQPKKKSNQYNDIVESAIKDYFNEVGIPAPVSKNVLISGKGDNCNVLTCKYSVENISNVSVEIKTVLEFINCDYEVVYRLDDVNTAYFFNKKNIDKSVRKAMKTMDGYTYNYTPKTEEDEGVEYALKNNNQPRPYIFKPYADIDKNVPFNDQEYTNRYALIIGNEDYSSRQPGLESEIDVNFARNDASAFKLYSLNILGIPETNVIFLLDATSIEMRQAIERIKLIIKTTRGNADVFVYFAGHGLPDDKTKAPYLMPVDVGGKTPHLGVKLEDFYAALSKYPSKRITVFLDACFSGGARNQGLVAARGVKIKPRKSVVNGSLIVFSASSGNEASLPYDEKKHGFFTYFLLQKLKETKGSITYGELADFLKQEIPVKSILLNNKEQTPQVNISSQISDRWREWEINEK